MPSVGELTLNKCDLLRSGSDAVLGYECVRPKAVAFRLFQEQLSFECAVAAILSQTK